MKLPLAVDSSALIAIIKGEPEEHAFADALLHGSPIIGWPTILETRIWLLRHSDGQARRWFENWLSTALTVAFDGELERLAAAAYDRFGKGRHPAALNFGDCMAFAVARHHDVPLLFKGSGFAKTDLKDHEASVVTA